MARRGRRRTIDPCGYLYILRDPRDGAVRYVGMTMCYQTRRAQHCSPDARIQGGEAYREWRQALRSDGLEPIMECVEAVMIYEPSEYRTVRQRMIREEGRLARRLEREGAQLVNSNRSEW